MLNFVRFMEAMPAGIEIKLLDDEDIEVPVGEVGEFCIRPLEPHVIMNGYFKNPEATLEAFRNLWYHTGDLGRCDEEGNYFFVDRKADFIRYGGRNISSFAVEAAISAHPAVRQCAAHGVTSADLPLVHIIGMRSAHVLLENGVDGEPKTVRLNWTPDVTSGCPFCGTKNWRGDY